MILEHVRLNAVGVVSDRGRLLLKRYGSEVNQHIEGVDHFTLRDFRPSTKEPNDVGQLMIDLLIAHAEQLLELDQLDYWFHEGSVPDTPPWEYYTPPEKPKFGGLNKLGKLL